MSWILSLLINLSTLAGTIAKAPAKTLCYSGGLLLILAGLVFGSIATVILGGAIVFIGSTTRKETQDE
jgi:hypothetical protein